MARLRAQGLKDAVSAPPISNQALLATATRSKKDVSNGHRQ